LDEDQQHRPPADTAGEVLQLVRDVAVQLHPRRRRSLRVALDSSLDRELGFDSLGRVELLYRLERAFDVRLPDELLPEAETPRDLLEAVLGASQGEQAAEIGGLRALELEVLAEVPVDAGTLTEMLDWHARAHADRPQLFLSGGSGGELTITYGELREQARAVARRLLERGVERGERVALMLPTGPDFFPCFFGILYAGAVPVPIYPPARRSQFEEHLRRQGSILRNAGAMGLVTSLEIRAVAALLRPLVSSLRWVETPERLRRSTDGPEPPSDFRSSELALIQYTSGSTGDPKGVALSHANLLANMRAFGQALEMCSTDIAVTWLPLYHDMGLIGAWLGPLYFGIPVAVLPPQVFLARPVRWLRAIQRHRATLGVAPNFAFELCLHKIDDRELEGLELGSLRLLGNGAEPVLPETLERFAARFGPFGLRREALAPIYGLAECTVGLAFSPPGRGPIVDRVQRKPMVRRGEALPADDDDSDALEFVLCGVPLPGHEVRVVDAAGRELGDRREGRLEFRGPSATRGYFRNEAKTRELFDGDWLDSGDRAYLVDGDIVVTGRIKDMVIRAGRNVYPHEIEQAVGEVEGVRRGCVAVFGDPDPDAGTERLVVVAETRERERAAQDALRARITEVATALLDEPPDEIVLAPPRTIPKTSSGKIRRSAARALLASGQLEAAPRALWWQVARITLVGATARVRRGLRALGERLYAVWWWTVAALTLVLGLGMLTLMPRRAWCWPATRAAGRLALGLTGSRISRGGVDPLPERCVLVANHASYLDSLVLATALPGELAFLAMAELAKFPPFAHVLNRLGAILVARGEVEGLEEATEAAIAAVEAGRRPVFYPEGTTTRIPGILPFRLGAFVVAARAGVPVVPIALHGTRSILRGQQWFPRRGDAELEIGPPLQPEGDDFGAATALRDATRAWMLEATGEPDLAFDQVHFGRERAAPPEGDPSA